MPTLKSFFSKLNTNMQNYWSSHVLEGKKMTTQETRPIQLRSVADSHHLSMQNALNSPAVQPQLSSSYFNMLFGQLWKKSSRRPMKLLS